MKRDVDFNLAPLLNINRAGQTCHHVSGSELLAGILGKAIEYARQGQILAHK